MRFDVLFHAFNISEHLDMIHLPSEKEQVQEAWKLIEGYFEGNGAKTNLWFKTRNPQLGDVSPYFMIYTGRIEKLLDFIKGNLLGNRP